MTKEAALRAFFSGFGIAAYPDTAVPKDVTFPYLTYQVVTSAFEEGPVSLTVYLWYFTSQESPPNQKARELSKALGAGGVFLPCDEGRIWLTRGAPWCTSVTDDLDPNIKGRYLNFNAEYLTDF